MRQRRDRPGVAPQLAVGPLPAQRELVPVLSQIRLLPSEIHAVWPHSRYLPAKTRAAIDILLAQMPSQLPGN
ncbi:LysR substrate-binding domain-containing protein [Serratia liquefaciens]|uniref:LysR substrate-binding domain-containing protein n=1 Tax=Serratia liquefaciens TaxID=614 RepID=UPI00061B5E9E|nr:LysR substrate-binding domain-containing protein [Serratia liquefaciens]AKE10921.1 hypothetical protein XJ20_13885 [Serratia liquefaciens]